MKYRVFLSIVSSFELEAPDQSSAEEAAEKMVESLTIAELVNEHGAVLHEAIVTSVSPE